MIKMRRLWQIGHQEGIARGQISEQGKREAKRGGENQFRKSSEARK